MIPRAKVNYSLGQILRSLFITDKRNDYRRRLIDDLKAFIGVRHVLLTPSGRGGLYLLLRTLPQKRVIVPAYTCKAVIEAAILANKEVVYIDSSPGSMNMDVDQLGAALTDSTIVVATHQYGIPCDIERIQQLCTDHGAFLLEDCAAALGTCINGRPAGTFGTAAFFSFDSTKLIHVPMKAGFVGTNNLDLHNRIEALSATVLRPMGIARKLTLLFQALILLSLESPILYRLFHALRFGLRGQYTSETSELSLELTPFHINQMSEWQAKIAVEQLGGVGNLVHQRQAVYNVMREALSNCTKFCLPPADSNCEWAPIRFPILCQNNKFDVYRAGNRRGIDFAFSFTNISCPTTMIHARLYASQVLDLPFYFKLSERDLTKVIQVVGALGQ